MTKYVLPVFKEVGLDGSEHDVDGILRRYGFFPTSELYEGSTRNGSILRGYSVDGVGREDAELRIFLEPAKISLYLQEQKELVALVVFHNVSKEKYSQIEAAVN